LYESMNLSVINERLEKLIPEYTEYSALENKLFTKEFIMKKCEKVLSLAITSKEKILMQNETKVLDDIFDFANKGEKWVVRVVICETKKQKTKQNSTIGNIFGKNNLLNAAIQLGPYLLYLENGMLKIGRVYDNESVMLFLYPNNNSLISPSNLETKEKIVKYLQEYRKDFGTPTKFVDGFLNSLKIKKNGQKNTRGQYDHS